MKNIKASNKIFLVSLFFLTMLVQQVQAADQDDYTQIITKRAQKIVDQLHLEQEKSVAVRDIVVQQYRDLNTVHTDFEQRKQAYKSILDKDEATGYLEKAEKTTEKKLAKLHEKYVKSLRKELTEDQLEQIKNGMTYSVLPITYQGYLDMLPSLTGQQKAQILTYLIEAREKAMDAGSSEEKHALFGKYKGKINNYLSKEGVETKIARQVWEKKIKEKQQRR